MPQCTYGSLRTTWGSWFSASTMRLQLRLSALAASPFVCWAISLTLIKPVFWKGLALSCDDVNAAVVPCAFRPCLPTLSHWNTFPVHGIWRNVSKPQSLVYPELQLMTSPVFSRDLEILLFPHPHPEASRWLPSLQPAAAERARGVGQNGTQCVKFFSVFFPCGMFSFSKISLIFSLSNAFHPLWLKKAILVFCLFTQGKFFSKKQNQEN